MNELNGHDIEDLRPGMHATFSKTITEADIVLFAGVSGDRRRSIRDDHVGGAPRCARPFDARRRTAVAGADAGLNP